MNLPKSFLDRPISHRALHNSDEGRAENSMKSVMAAIEHGYGIEIDLQLSKDGQAMVFHDYDLGRLTSVRGPIAQKTAAELSDIKLLNDGDGIPTLIDVLNVVAGRVPLLIELKDQDGAMGPNVGKLEIATADALESYNGDVALMSFNPHSVAKLAEVAPNLPRGIVTCAYDAEDWPTLPKARRQELVDIPDFARVGACFISHDRTDLERSCVAEIKAAGHPILCWTVRSKEDEITARKVADNITFESYLA